MKKYMPENKQQVNEEEEEGLKSTGKEGDCTTNFRILSNGTICHKTERSLHIKRTEERLNMNNAEDEKLKSAEEGVKVWQHLIFHTTAMTRGREKRIQEREIRRSKPDEQRNLKSTGYELKMQQASGTQRTVPFDDK
ncbi:uncharacterized protein LOC134180454 [Corticium candelabrum]|uniref:uncharacterized protein LOC134180454 n=1 Tax=Corticium candelabrum TaxID=121492 RepID=UPI002E2593D3|nr:uncharacterized protein LOC134180454 [Corticium candelabrum]